MTINTKETQPEKKTFISRLPRLSKVSQILLISGICAVFLIPSILIKNQQQSKQAMLQQELTNLENILSVPLTEKERLQAEINKVEAEREIAIERFPKADPGIAIVQGLYELADKNDLIISRIDTLRNEDKNTSDQFAVLSFRIYVTGQISKVQNFLLDVNERYQTSVMTKALFIILEGTGSEDTSTLDFDIYHFKEAE
jgi:cell division protein FtsL